MIDRLEQTYDARADRKNELTQPFKGDCTVSADYKTNMFPV